MTTNDPTLRKLSEMPLTCASCKACQATGCGLRSEPFNPALVSHSRRAFVAGSAGVIALATIGGSVVAQDTSTTTTSTALTCTTLTPERTEGPYYIDDLLLRDDITEGKEGIPLELSVEVMDVTTCEPMVDAAVDIWHCDALGDYSGISGQNGNDDTGGQTWLRGVQLTGTDGVATITTIYPGWYVSRATHIHMKVHVGGTADDGTYLGGTTAHTGQFFIDDELNDAVAQLDPYNTRLDVYRTRNDEDNVLNGALNEPGFLLTMTPNVEGDYAQGFKATVTVGIDPSAESAESGMDNSGGGNNGRPGGNNDRPSPPGN
ncbi:MAG: intradiol ring-cleavage dioxygenase [Thermomicrobiales bacterium]|nr:intradiol ring-cleavage dioxygenase [Thermomicrobiales bacterium]MCO5225079.1 intradiol ring-cleavage dioxygenase [Thermomicrobiales bacterium]MCO5228131.1 intradiol ring-cleavage dioxygenase [Thermomicrobiales bacterium]